MPTLRTCLLFVSLICLPLAAHAWGSQGHRIVGELAARQLTPAASAQVQRLLAGEPEPTLAGIANWADQLRESDPELGKKSSRWHYINFPRSDCSYVPPRDCPDGNCAIAAINRNFLALSDTRRSDAERRDALKFLVHLVGDIHQPLHAGYADDRGGNDFQINYRDTGWNLHSVWDSLIVKSSGLDPAAYAARLSREPALPADPTLRSDRPAVEWALESCRIIEADHLYPDKHVIGDDYLQAHRAEVDRRLRQAGRRLAGMINFALSQPKKP